jgi:hypothetical protein
MKPKSESGGFMGFLIKFILNMKLFITNKDVFGYKIDGHNEQKENSLNSYLVHKKAFNELQTFIVSKNAIPIQIAISVDDEMNLVFFEFQNKKGDIYFYEFQTD